MAQIYPGFDSKEQHDDYVAALDNELAVLKARKSPRAKEVEAEIAKHRESKPRAKAADDRFAGHTVVELTEMARDRGIDGYSALNKAELVAALEAEE